MDKTIIAGNIRRVVDKMGYKHIAVAEKAGYTKSQFSDMLNGRKSIGADDIYRIKTVLGCTYDELFAQPQ